MHIALIDICNVKSMCVELDLDTLVNRRVIFAISRGFYFQETSHPRSFMKIKASRKFLNLQNLVIYTPDSVKW